MIKQNTSRKRKFEDCNTGIDFNSSRFPPKKDKDGKMQLRGMVFKHWRNSLTGWFEISLLKREEETT